MYGFKLFYFWQHLATQVFLRVETFHSIYFWTSRSLKSYNWWKHFPCKTTFYFLQRLMLNLNYISKLYYCQPTFKKHCSTFSFIARKTFWRYVNKKATFKNQYILTNCRPAWMTINITSSVQRMMYIYLSKRIKNRSYRQIYWLIQLQKTTRTANGK